MLLLVLLLILMFGVGSGPYWGAPYSRSYGFGGGGLLLIIILFLVLYRGF